MIINLGIWSHGFQAIRAAKGEQPKAAQTADADSPYPHRIRHMFGMCRQRLTLQDE